MRSQKIAKGAELANRVSDRRSAVVIAAIALFDRWHGHLACVANPLSPLVKTGGARVKLSSGSTSSL
jgi:hypothetical protein